MGIDVVGGWLKHNIVVFVAVIVLPLKFSIVRFCGDKEAEALSALAVPEDLCWVSLGLVLGDIINSAGAFRQYFSKSDHTDIDLIIAVGLNLSVAVGVHWLSQLCSSQFKLWRAAQRAQQAVSNPQQGELPLPNGQENLKLLMLRHFLLFCGSYGLQFCVVMFWLHWIADVIAVQHN